MAQRPLEIMISSRSDAFSIPDGAGGDITLRDVRLALKADLAAATFLDGPLVKVWINETEHGNQNDTAWDECVKRAVECDLFVALYDGTPGWERGGLGICHAEFDAAFNSAPQKVQIVRLPNPNRSGTDSAKRFKEALTRAHRFETQPKKDWPHLKTAIRSLVRDMVLRAGLEGARQFRKSGLNVGQALDWTRMDFVTRSATLRTTIAEVVGASGDQANLGRAVRRLDNKSVLFVCHGAPRSLSESSGREAVGKPFMADHKLVGNELREDIFGPVHLVGCPKSVTDLQAITFLGTSDITVVPGLFGVYAADRVNMVQACLLADCTDGGSTRNAVNRLFEWLARSGEQTPMLQRAQSRRRILAAIATEFQTGY